jgi:hypothetical protein
VRITQDITPIFFQNSKAVKNQKQTKHQHPDAQVENVEYLHILKPSLDSFIHSYHPLDISLLDLSLKLFLFLNRICSLSFLEDKRVEHAMKQIQKKKGKSE